MCVAALEMPLNCCQKWGSSHHPFTHFHFCVPVICSFLPMTCWQILLIHGGWLSHGLFFLLLVPMCANHENQICTYFGSLLATGHCTHLLPFQKFWIAQIPHQAQWVLILHMALESAIESPFPSLWSRISTCKLFCLFIRHLGGAKEGCFNQARC